MTPSHLTFSQIAWLVGFAVAMSLGQLLFKAAAQVGLADAPLTVRLVAIATNAYFLTAILLYTMATFLWVWILTFTPLSFAYPFAALAFAITPLLAGIVFGDPITGRLLAGCLFIVLGIIVIAI